MTFALTLLTALFAIGCLLLWFIWRALDHIGDMLFHLWQVAHVRHLQRLKDRGEPY